MSRRMHGLALVLPYVCIALRLYGLAPVCPARLLTGSSSACVAHNIH